MDSPTKPSADSAFQVYVRVRPMNSRELNLSGTEALGQKMMNIVQIEDNLIFINDQADQRATYNRNRSYAFDHVFSDKDDNNAVFNKTLVPLIENVFSGLNGTCFAYGMTGAGKTHTMLGDIYRTSTCEAGVSSLALDALFEKISGSSGSGNKCYTIKMSYLEIYNEHVRDLLADPIVVGGSSKSGNAMGLMIVEDPIKGVVVPELSEYEVKTGEDYYELVLRGNERRTMAETAVNKFSSRSHAILQLNLTIKNKSPMDYVEQVITARLSFVDLAGSERAATSENRGLRMREGGTINRSLLALGNCINILSDKDRAGSSFVPYRDSKLTRLLKESLGGNTKTIMISCISPASAHYEETINTLKYAERAKKIKKRLSRNVKDVAVHISQYKEIIESLKKEIAELKKNTGAFPMIVSSTMSPIEGGLRGSQDLGPGGLKMITGSMPPVTTSSAQPSISAIEEEIKKAKELKEQMQKEIEMDQEELVASLKLSQEALIDDTGHIEKISQELQSKFEDHYSIIESIQQLNQCHEENQAEIEEKQRILDELVKKKTSLSSSNAEPEEQKSTQADIELNEKRIYEVSQEIDRIKETMEKNERIRKELEQAMTENKKIMQKFNSLLLKIQSQKKKEMLELQITVRSLKMDKIKLVLENLESQKTAQLVSLQSNDKEKELEIMRKELERVKGELKTKDKLLESTKNQIMRQSQELFELKSGKSRTSSIKEDSKNGSPYGRSVAKAVKGSSTSSFRILLGKTEQEGKTERNTVGGGVIANSRKSSIQGKPCTAGHSAIPIVIDLKNYKKSLQANLLQAQPMPSKDTHEAHKKSSHKKHHQPNSRYANKTDAEDKSFVSLSSVSVNYDNVSNSDLDFVDSCMDALGKQKQDSARKKNVPGISASVRMMERSQQSNDESAGISLMKGKTLQGEELKRQKYFEVIHKGLSGNSDSSKEGPVIAGGFSDAGLFMGGKSVNKSKKMKTALQRVDEEKRETIVIKTILPKASYTPRQGNVGNIKGVMGEPLLQSSKQFVRKPKSITMRETMPSSLMPQQKSQKGNAKIPTSSRNNNQNSNKIFGMGDSARNLLEAQDADGIALRARSLSLQVRVNQLRDERKMAKQGLLANKNSIPGTAIPQKKKSSATGVIETKGFFSSVNENYAKALSQLNVRSMMQTNEKAAAKHGGLKSEGGKESGNNIRIQLNTDRSHKSTSDFGAIPLANSQPMAEIPKYQLGVINLYNITNIQQDNKAGRAVPHRANKRKAISMRKPAEEEHKTVANKPKEFGFGVTPGFVSQTCNFTASVKSGLPHDSQFPMSVASELSAQSCADILEKPSTGKLNQEIGELIQKQKEKLKQDFEKAKEQDEKKDVSGGGSVQTAKSLGKGFMGGSTKPEIPALASGDIDEAIGGSDEDGIDDP